MSEHLKRQDIIDLVNDLNKEEEIKKAAEEFFKNFEAQFPPNVICPVCKATNCPYNDHCINCNLQL